MFGHIILTITTTILNLNPSFVHTQNIWSHLWERNGGGQRERERESSTALLHDLSRPDGVGAKEQMPSSFVKSAITHTTPKCQLDSLIHSRGRDLICDFLLYWRLIIPSWPIASTSLWTSIDSSECFQTSYQFCLLDAVARSDGIRHDFSRILIR